MMRALVAAVAAALVAGPAVAGEGLICDGPEGVSVTIALGGGVGAAPLGATIEANGKTLATDAGVGTPVVIAKAFAGESRYLYDFADTNQETILAEVRLFFAHVDGFEPALGGTLRVVGVGAWPIACTMG
jgi:hypothetical protein